MFKFFLKKNFCDGWDNFFFLILSNAVNIALLALFYLGFRFLGGLNPYYTLGAFILAFGILMVSIFAWGANAAKLADFRAPAFSVFFAALKSVWKIGFLFGVFIAISLLLARFAIAYYLRMYFNSGSLLGLFITAALGWFILVSAIALQWFIPLYFLQENNGFKKCLKKSFIIFYDNVGFSIEVFLFNILLFALSIVTFLFVPGLNGITLSSMNALRLRLYKYDWIEDKSKEDPSFENDRERRSQVPWDELIAQDVEALGPRKFSSFIFPWK
ncbi:MAG: hypothetical protein K5873_01400 [Treponema sp.]|nr:hypothetical protein [Treponema sp.]